MKYIVSVNGLPPSYTFSHFRRALKKMLNVKVNYWIQNIQYVTASQTSKVVLETNSKVDAEKMVSILSGQKITDNLKKYVFTACIESCELSPSGNPDEIPTQQKVKLKKNANKLSKSQENKSQLILNQIPKFVQSKVIILNDMVNLIDRHCHKQRSLFLRVFEVAIRLRLSHLFEGRSLKEVYDIPASDVVDMYRKIYDKSSDESFVIETCQLIQLACWPGLETMKDGVYLEENDIDGGNITNVANTEDICDNNSESVDINTNNNETVMEEEPREDAENTEEKNIDNDVNDVSEEKIECKE